IAETLARAGIGRLTLVDFDTVAVHNINRQIMALSSTVGQDKADVMAERIREINPCCEISVRKEMVTPENVASYFTDVPDYVADAIDDVPAKVSLIRYCMEHNIPLISAMGTGNKLHPELLEISDISKTEVCPLCRSVRKKLRDIGIKKGLTVVYSREIPIQSGLKEDGRSVPASSPFVPSVAGIMMASHIVNRILAEM
ncbi:MAG: tRNA threonylcarbamoyladenosine dehydratase, partial [Firmicutes bacterium]|nr:tRNA threonylcarbamoyladenosine dehydratase [Bacillota bacterium]